MTNNLPDQDKGIAHCFYIKLLATEVWMKENSNPSGHKISWEDAIKFALEFHVKKLMKSKTVTTIKNSVLPINRP